jgi:hypothetical protein
MPNLALAVRTPGGVRHVGGALVADLDAGEGCGRIAGGMPWNCSGGCSGGLGC